MGRLPPRCRRQRRLQEHLLRHHTRRGEGGVNGAQDMSWKTAIPLLSACSVLPLPSLPFVLPSTSAASRKTTHTDSCCSWSCLRLLMGNRDGLWQRSFPSQVFHLFLRLSSVSPPRLHPFVLFLGEKLKDVIPNIGRCPPEWKRWEKGERSQAIEMSP